MTTNLSDFQLERREKLIRDAVWSQIRIHAEAAAENDPAARPRKMMLAVAESSGPVDLESLEMVAQSALRWIHAACFVRGHPDIQWPAVELLERPQPWRFEWAAVGFDTLTVSLDDCLPPVSSQENPAELARDPEIDTDVITLAFCTCIELGHPFDEEVHVGVGWSIRAGVVGLFPRRD